MKTVFDSTYIIALGRDVKYKGKIYRIFVCLVNSIETEMEAKNIDSISFTTEGLIYI